MQNKNALMEFIEPYYREKDIMHNMWHIELVKKMTDKILSVSSYEVDRECLYLAMYFHGFIYKEEERITQWLCQQGYSDEVISKVIQIAWESQRNEIPKTIEGMILHDAHVLEGGKAYLIVKTLITGSVRGQSLVETIRFMENNVLDRNQYYLPETIPLCTEMNRYTKEFYKILVEGIE